MATALIVDDHAENRYLLRCILMADGYEVLEAAHGQEALTLAKSHEISVIVADILMPVMDGFALCRACREDSALRNIPFVFYTATYTDPRDEAFARSLGADDFIVKPMDPANLRDRIRAAVARVVDVNGPLGTPAGLGETPYLKQYNEVLIRKLEDKLTELEAANAALVVKDFALASSTSGILLADLAANVTYANPAVERVLDLTSERLIGTNVRGHIRPPENFESWLAAREGALPFETRIVLPSRVPEVRWISVIAQFICSHAGEPVGVMFACADVTEERRLREDLARAQRFEALGQFSAGVAHDFNNLLVAVLAGLEFASSDEIDESERREYRATGLAAVNRAKELTSRLLSFSRSNVAKKRTLDLIRILEESLLLSFSGSGIRCVTHFDANPANVEGDAGQLAQAFGNLFINARQAMGDAGTLTVAVTKEERAREGSKSYFMIRVCDDGPGISPSVLPQVFEPYFTTKKSGHGLGLATCHAIVRDHEGRISAASEVGKGATFEVWLPESGEIPESSARQVVEDVSHGSGRLLVMDDQVITQALMQRSLERAGYSVVSVANGEQALLEFERARQIDAPFELAILDVTVRGALGGLETLLALRRQGHVLPVVASTGYTDDASQTNLLQCGFDRVLGKPFYVHELLSVVKAALGSRTESLRESPPTVRSGEV
jgi:PAS domain S-box-containing protein